MTDIGLAALVFIGTFLVLAIGRAIAKMIAFVVCRHINKKKR